MTAIQFSLKAGISYQKTLRLIREGKVAAIGSTNGYNIPVSSLDKYLATVSEKSK